MLKTQNWFALDVTVDAAASEAIEFGLNELAALGTEINNLGKKATENICVTGYFSDLPTDETVQTELAEALRIYGFSFDIIQKIDSRPVENADWLSEWKKHWKPTVTERFIIAPPWEKIEETDKIVIHIEPNMAFGTGTHETTRLCLKAIEENYLGGETFYDVGTGTGILAIAVAEFQVSGFRFQVEEPKVENYNLISGCDTDEDSIKIAEENAEINGVGDKINFYVGSISEETVKYDFVCANLTADVILPLLPLLIEKTKRILVLSGILKEQEDSVLAELRNLKIENPKIETSGEWISVIVENGKWKMEN